VLSLTFGCGADTAGFSEKVPVSIQVLPANQTISFGTDQQFTATGMYADNSSRDLTTFVFWDSSSTLVATISNAANSNGLATAVANGSTTITATHSGVSSFATLTVSTATLTSIDVTPVNPSVLVNGTQQFTATGHYSDGTTAILTQSTNLTWSSSDTSIATIANTPTFKKGKATGVSPGAVIIQAREVLSSVTGTTTLTVN